MKAVNVIGSFLLLMLISFPVQSQNRTYKLISGSRMQISGDSNAHEWQEQVKNMGGSAIIETDGKSVFNLTQLNFKAEVKSIESSNGSIMDNKTHDAFDADKYPYITFDLTKVKTISPVQGGFWLTTEGNVTMHGVKKLMAMDVKAIMNSNGTISFEGNKTFNMSLFGIDPPTAMMGTMKVKDPVRIDFKITYQ